MSHSTLISSFSTPPSGAYYTTFHCVKTCFSFFFLNITVSFLCNIVVLPFVFLLSRFLTYACYVLHTFTFFSTQSTQGAFTGLIDVVLHIVCPDSQSCVTHNNASFTTFKSPLDNHCHVFSLSNFSVVSLMNFRALVFHSTFLLVLLLSVS